MPMPFIPSIYGKKKRLAAKGLAAFRLTMNRYKGSVKINEKSRYAGCWQTVSLRHDR